MFVAYDEPLPKTSLKMRGHAMVEISLIEDSTLRVVTVEIVPDVLQAPSKQGEEVLSRRGAGRHRLLWDPVVLVSTRLSTRNPFCTTQRVATRLDWNALASEPGDRLPAVLERGLRPQDVVCLQRRARGQGCLPPRSVSGCSVSSYQEPCGRDPRGEKTLLSLLKTARTVGEAGLAGLNHILTAATQLGMAKRRGVGVVTMHCTMPT